MFVYTVSHVRLAPRDDLSTTFGPVRTGLWFDLVQTLKRIDSFRFYDIRHKIGLYYKDGTTKFSVKMCIYVYHGQVRYQCTQPRDQYFLLSLVRLRQFPLRDLRNSIRYHSRVNYALDPSFCTDHSLVISSHDFSRKHLVPCLNPNDGIITPYLNKNLRDQEVRQQKFYPGYYG